jgi:hypothetical protein
VPSSKKPTSSVITEFGKAFLRVAAFISNRSSTKNCFELEVAVFFEDLQETMIKIADK